MYEKPEVKIIATEIASKKKGYIIIEKSTREQLENLLWQATQMLKSIGAKYVYVKFSDKNLDEMGEMVNAKHFVYRQSHELHILEYDLAKYEKVEGIPIKILPISIGDGKQFLQIYNKAFHDVPNSATYNDGDIDRILNDEDFAGYFILYKDEIVGILEMNYKDEITELASIGIKKEQENKGIARAAIEKILETEKAKGAKKISIMVASNNEKAYKLYEKIGFTYKLTQSKFYEAKM